MPDISTDEIVRMVQKNMKHIEFLDFSLLRCAVFKASFLKDNKKVIFGSRKLFNALKFFKYKQNPKVSLEELQKKFHEKKYNRPLFLRGSSHDPCGNRKAELDIIDNNSVILKFNKDTHVEVKLPQLNKKHLAHLSKLQDLCAENKACFSLEVNNEYIYIIFEESYIKNPKSHKSIENRILSLDLNPNYIGLSICDWSGENKNLIYKEIIDIIKLSTLKQDSYKKHKRDYETSEVNKRVIELAQHYQCELIVFEKLGIESQDWTRGKCFNRLVNNCWNRTKLIQNLIKRCNIAGIKYHDVPAAYSSFIGQMQNETEYDSIAASLELSRRAYVFNKAIKEKHKKIRNILFPIFNVSVLPTRWKERALDEGIKSWKELYYSLKKSKSRYRFLFVREKFKGISFSLNSNKSLVEIHEVCS
jgi:hypothetical protein